MSNVSFGKMKPIVNGKEGDEVDVVYIERGPGNLTAFPVDEEAEKNADGKVITYGEKYKDFRDSDDGHRDDGDISHEPAIEPTPYEPDPSPDAHLYPEAREPVPDPTPIEPKPETVAS